MYEALERTLKVFGLACEMSNEIGCDLGITHGSAVARAPFGLLVS